MVCEGSTETRGITDPTSFLLYFPRAISLPGQTVAMTVHVVLQICYLPFNEHPVSCMYPDTLRFRSLGHTAETQCSSLIRQ